MKIVMLCPMINSSSFITTYPFAKILSKKHEVKIVGPIFGKEPYIKDKNLNFEFIEPLIKKPIQIAFMSLIKKNYKKIKNMDFDVIHAFKLLPHTAPVAAKLKKELGKKFVLSIDDYDVKSPKNLIKKYILKKSEKSYLSADAIIVSSRFLEKIYGGKVIYQVANESIFMRKHSKKNIIKKYNLENKKVIIHAGTFYEHKGIDILIRAVQKLNRKDVKLLLIGNGNIEKYKKIAGPETIFVGKVSIEEIPKYISCADIYVIPTKNTEYARAEIPAKIFEPMIMGKAIIASRISDISEILDNEKCGLLTKPDDIDSLKEKLEFLLDNPKIREELGKKAKKRYLEKYSYREIEKKVNKIYSKL